MTDSETVKYEKTLQANAKSYCGKMKEPQRTECFEREQLEIKAWKKVMDTNDIVLTARYPCYEWEARMEGKEMVAEFIVSYEQCRDDYLETIRMHSTEPESKLAMFDKVGLALEGLSNLHSVDVEPILEAIEAISDLEMDGSNLKILPVENKREAVLLCAANLGGDGVYTEEEWIGVWWD